MGFLFLTSPAEDTENTESQNQQNTLNASQLTEDELLIESDSMHYDDAELTSVYLGNVIVRQVNRVMFGEKVIVHYDNEKKVDFIEAFGSPARFEQARSKTTEKVDAQANYIEYLKGEELLNLNEEVFLTKVDFQSTSNSLTYNLKTKEIRAESDKENRVEMILK